MKSKYFTIYGGQVFQVLEEFTCDSIEKRKGIEMYISKKYDYPIIKAAHKRSAAIKFIRLFGWNLKKP